MVKWWMERLEASATASFWTVSSEMVQPTDTIKKQNKTKTEVHERPWRTRRPGEEETQRTIDGQSGVRIITNRAHNSIIHNCKQKGKPERMNE